MIFSRKHKEKRCKLSVQIITDNLFRNLSHSLSSLASEMPEDLSHLKKAVSCDCCYDFAYCMYNRLRSRNLFQGITRPAFITKTSAAPIAMVEENRDACFLQQNCSFFIGRDKFVIATKFGVTFTSTTSGKPELIRSQLAGLPPKAGHRLHRPLLPAPHGPQHSHRRDHGVSEAAGAGGKDQIRWVVRVHTFRAPQGSRHTSCDRYSDGVLFADERYPSEKILCTILTKIMPKIKMARLLRPNSWYLDSRSCLMILPPCPKILATILPSCV